MGLFQVVLVCLLATVTWSQELQDCDVDISPFTVRSTEDAATLATSLRCSTGVLTVEWVGEVFVVETIHVTSGTSLNITGTGPDATADGQDSQQLFLVDAGSRLHLSDIALARGSASGAPFSSGGAIYSNQSSVSFSGNVSFVSNSADERGGAIYATSSNVDWSGDGIQFRFNSANDGGAIFADGSSVSWDGSSTHFTSNSAFDGGAIHVRASTLSWSGDDSRFDSNVAHEDGGAIYALEGSAVSWEGDATRFNANSANEDGGAIYAEGSAISWKGDDIQFTSNSVNQSGGALYALESTVSWTGDRVRFDSNSAGVAGGAIHAYESDVVWDGENSELSSNSASGFGGAVHAEYSAVSWGGNTTFRGNVAGGNGGALASTDMKLLFFDDSGNLGPVHLSGARFVDNRAASGGAVYLANSLNSFNFTDVLFWRNSANGAGGAVAAYGMGAAGSPLVFSRSLFSENVAGDTGGAVDTLTGQQEFARCDFEDNSADVGGAMRLGGSAGIWECSFSSNVASTRGLAITVVGSANITRSSFDSNELSCAAGSYRNDEEEKDDPTARFGTVCFECPEWDKCLGCTIANGRVTPTCEAPLEHTSAEEPGVTLATLTIDGGYWRATPDSEIVLECYNEDACLGGKTGSDSYCAPEYTGPCYTCTRCSSSRREVLVAIAAIAALVVVFAVAKTLQYLLSTELEERRVGWFHRRVLRAVPVQALKIVVVVWQILTQFAEAAQVTYPGVYQAFLSAISFFNFDLGSLLAAGCFWSEIDFHDQLLISTLGPLVGIGFLATTYRIAVARNSAAGQVGLEKIRHKHQTALLLLTFFIYSSASSTVFQTFACETLDDDVEYLRADYRIVCTDAKHRAFEVYAGIMIMVYPVGIPLLYAALLFQRRHVLADAGADKTVAQPIAGLWEPYRPERYYYEVVECGRRIMLTGVVVFIFPNDAAQIAVTMLIAFVFLMVFEMLSPYESESDMWLSRGGHVIVFLSMFYLLALKVNVSDEREASQGIFAGVLVASHVLMVVAIIVEVFGVWYSSRQVSATAVHDPRSTRTINGDDEFM
eukprot:g11816.t1